MEHDKSAEEVVAEVKAAYPGASGLCAFFTETPANPTMDLYSVKKARKIADALGSEEHPVPVVVDNTYLGPTMSRQHENGADIVVYSVTKNLAGHSDVIAGAATGKTAWINRLRVARTFIGGILGPMDSWLILRSLETFTLRIAAQQKTTHEVAAALAQHPAVKEVRYLGNLEQWSPGQAAFFEDEYQGTGSMIALHIHGDESAAFKVLDHLKVFRLGVSLGSTESLAEHPSSMTHSKVDDAVKEKLGITEGLIRLSIGLEATADLIARSESEFRHDHLIPLPSTKNNAMNTATLPKQYEDAQDFLELWGTDYVEFYVGNAKQSAYYFKTAFGFQEVAYAGLETGVTDRTSYVLQQDKIRLVITSSLVEDIAISIAI